MSVDQIRAALDEEWAEFLVERNAQGKLTQAENWRRANPGEWAKLQAYRNGEVRPSLATSTGQQMVEHVDAWLLTAPQPVPPGPTPPDGPFTVTDGGGATVSSPALFARTTNPVTISKQQVRNMTGYGIGSMQFFPPTVEETGVTTISDCIATDVRQPQPGKMGGTGEACFWFGNKTKASRLYAARAGWMGAFVGAKCHDSLIEDFEVVECPVGVYLEHEAHNVTFRRLFTSAIRDQPVAGGSEPGGVLAARSVSVEWWYRDPVYGNRLTGSHSITFERCDIYCPSGNDPRCGVYVGPGTYGVRFLGCRFWGPGVAVRLPTIRHLNGPDAVFDGCVFDNDGQHVVYHSLPMG